MSLRIGVVGAGNNTRKRHIPGFQEIDGVEVTAVCNRSRESGEKAAEEFRIPNVFEDWKELVQSDQVDAVCVGTWPYMHCPVTLETLKAGKHILTEARMAMDLAEARQMLEASQASDKVAMIVPAPFHLDSEPFLLEMIEEGSLGDILEVHMRQLGGGFNPDAPANWRQKREYSGRNIMALGIWNETIHRYAGFEKTVSAWGKAFVPERKDAEAEKSIPMEIPDSVGIVAEMENGATAVYHLSSNCCVASGPEILIYGTQAGIRLADGKAWIARKGVKEWLPLEVPEEKKGGWRVEQDFVDSIRDGTPVTRTNFEDGVKYMAFTEAVHRSLGEGKRIEVSAL